MSIITAEILYAESQDTFVNVSAGDIYRHATASHVTGHCDCASDARSHGQLPATGLCARDVEKESIQNLDKALLQNLQRLDGL